MRNKSLRTLKPSCLISVPSIRYYICNFNAILCNFMQFHAISCNFIQFHEIFTIFAILSNFMQFYAILCNFMQFYAILCNFMQFYAILCNFMQIYAILCNYMQFYTLICNSMQFYANKLKRFYLVFDKKSCFFFLSGGAITRMRTTHLPHSNKTTLGSKKNGRPLNSFKMTPRHFAEWHKAEWRH